MCDFILYFNDYVLHLCVINDDDDDISKFYPWVLSSLTGHSIWTIIRTRGTVREWQWTT